MRPLFIYRKLSSIFWNTLQFIRLYAHKSGAHCNTVSITIGCFIICLARDEGQPCIIFMLEDGSIFRADDAVLTHLIRISRSVRMDNDLITPFKFAKPNKRARLAIGQIDMSR